MMITTDDDHGVATIMTIMIKSTIIIHFFSVLAYKQFTLKPLDYVYRWSKN